jgi:RNA polymerase sigma-70 factor (ECF subfamily)
LTTENASQTGSTLYALLADMSNRAAWNRFVDRYTPGIYAWCCRRGLQDADARNVTQEVLCKLYRSLGTYDRARGPFRPWLRTIVRNAWRDFLHDQNRSLARGTGDSRIHHLLANAEVEDDLAEALDEEFHRELLETAMERVRRRVRPSTWQAFRQSALEGRAVEEVSSGLGLTRLAVYMARHRVQGMLREEIARLEQAPPVARPTP